MIVQKLVEAVNEISAQITTLRTDFYKFNDLNNVNRLEVSEKLVHSLSMMHSVAPGQLECKTKILRTLIRYTIANEFVRLSKGSHLYLPTSGSSAHSHYIIKSGAIHIFGLEYSSLLSKQVRLANEDGSRSTPKSWAVSDMQSMVYQGFTIESVIVQ